MPVNTRVYYPVHAIGFAPLGTSPTVASGFRAAKGVQQVGMNTTFSLVQVYELGQLSLYENIENLPDVEVTVEKVADGYSLIEHLATPTATAATLAGRFNDNQCMGLMAFYPTSNDSASGTPLTYVLLSGLFVSAINWNIPVDGNMTESVTLTCRDKTWTTAGVVAGTPWSSGAFRTQGFAGGGADSPVIASGGVQRRENILMHSGSIWPKEIPGINQTNGYNPSGSNGFGAHIQNVTVGTNFGRTDLLELGRKGPYARYANFPTQVTTSIEITASESGDNVNVASDADNLSNQQIKIITSNGIIIDLGTKNKLSGITFGGGDTGGGNKTVTYNYENFNDYTCTMAVTDPAGL